MGGTRKARGGVRLRDLYNTYVHTFIHRYIYTHILQSGGSLGGGYPQGSGGGAPEGFSKTICHVSNLPFQCTDDALAFAFGT